MPLLETRGLTRSFGGLVAVDEVDFAVEEGEIVGLIGPNGAGKTTFFNVITGVYSPSAGSVTFLGKDISGLLPSSITARGMARTFQNIRLYNEMTALENVMVGQHCRMTTTIVGAILRTRRAKAEERRVRYRALELLEYVGLRQQAGEVSRNLPYGHQRRLEIARALATEPSLLFLDEPVAGMNPQESQDVMRLIRTIRDRGHHHHPHRARHEGGHGDLRPGGGPGPRGEDRGRAAGRRAKRSQGDRGLPGEEHMSGDDALLQVRDVDVFYGAIQALRGVSLDIHAGEIVTLIGGNGAGKSTMLNTISGLIRPRRGTVVYGGRDLGSVPPYETVSLGLSQVPEGRRIFPRMTVRENLDMGAFSRPGQDLRPDFDRVFDLFPVLKERSGQPGGTLSGGEQQMLAIGRALMARPTLLMLDEPSMGLAPMLVERIFDIIAEINGQGTTILLVEQNANVALETSNRGYVLETGTVVLADDAKALLQNPRVQQAYLGGA